MSSSNDCERSLLRKAKYTSLSHETAGAGHSIVADSKDCCLTPPPSVEFIAAVLEFVNAAQAANFMETKDVRDYNISRLRDSAERLAEEGRKPSQSSLVSTTMAAIMAQGFIARRPLYLHH